MLGSIYSAMMVEIRLLCFLLLLYIRFIIAIILLLFLHVYGPLLCYLHHAKSRDICFVPGREKRLSDEEGGRADGRFTEVGIKESESGR